MRYLTILFIGFVLFTSCESTRENSEDNTIANESINEEPTSDELEENSKKLIATLVNAKDLNLRLNEGEKWKISEDAFTKLMKIKQQIYVISGNMESYEIKSYNTMGAEFLEFVKTIPIQESQITNTELQKVIKLTSEQCMHLVGSNLQSAQIAVINLSTIYENVPTYFEVE